MAVAMAKLAAFPLLVLFFLAFTLSPALSQGTTALVTPIQKDQPTLQYIITAYLGTPLKQTKLLLDIGASYMWIDCDNYNYSSSYKHIPCNNLLCEFIGSYACLMNCHPTSPNCGDSICELEPQNPIKPIGYTPNGPYAPALVDYFSMPVTTDSSTRGSNTLASETTFIFSCAYTDYLKGLAKGVTGLAGLGRSSISIPAQVSKFYSSQHRFAICLSGLKSRSGWAIFGSKGAYNFLPGSIDLSKSLLYTPLILNPVGKNSYVDLKRPSPEYFIGLTSIKVNRKVVALNQSLLAIDGENGSGGTKISTVVPYTKLETSIYKAVTGAFVKEAASSAFNLTTTEPVQPFTVCYPASSVKSTTRVGPTVPTIDLVFDRQDVVWKIFGSNSMVRITEKGGVDVWCLGLVDGGVRPATSTFVVGDPSIVIGGYQMEDNLLQFDLGSMKLGFSSSILPKGTNCANFKLSSN